MVSVFGTAVPAAMDDVARPACTATPSASTFCASTAPPAASTWIGMSRGAISTT